MKLILISTMLLLFSFVSEARVIEPSDIGKVFSREASSPISRQGSCFVFQYAFDYYCVSSYHVAYNSNFGYVHKVTFEDGTESPLEWQAGDWGRGMVLLKLTDPPKRNYIHWKDIQFLPEDAKLNARMMAWGFPLNVSVMNTAYGETEEADANKFPLFVYIRTFIFLKSVATEIGFSGGALITEDASTFAGVLSHQVLQDGQVLTVAIPGFEVRDWLDRHLDALGIKNNTFFYVQPRQFEQKHFTVYMRWMSFEVAEYPDSSAMITFNFDSHAFEDMVGPNKWAARFPKLFPKLKPALSTTNDNFSIGRYFFVGCTPYWPIYNVSEVKLFWTGAEFAKRIGAPGMYTDNCGYYNFVNTGMLGHRLSDRTQELLKIWQLGLGKVAAKEAPAFFSEWKNFFDFVTGRREDRGNIINQNHAALIRLDLIEALLTNSKTQNDQKALREKYPNEFLQLEQALQALIAVHKATVVQVSAPQLIDDPKDNQ